MKLEGKLAELRALQDEYYCKGDLEIKGVPFAEKTMTAIIAPTGVGKSTITNEILRLAEIGGISATEGGTDTTRPHRPDDNATYRTDVPFDEMISRIHDREYANWSVTPSGHIYATPVESLTAEHNFLPCLPESYVMLKRAADYNRVMQMGFAVLNAFYLVTPVEAWDEQIKDRKGLADFPGRMEEALDSLEFARKTHALQKIVSLPGDEELAKTAQTILNFAVKKKSELSNTFGSHYQTTTFDRHSREMYSWAIDLSQQYNS